MKNDIQAKICAEIEKLAATDTPADIKMTELQLRIDKLEEKLNITYNRLCTVEDILNS